MRQFHKRYSADDRLTGFHVQPVICYTGLVAQFNNWASGIIKDVKKKSFFLETVLQSCFLVVL
jgi:hypothetical protein